ncbi:hypothetical protein AKO1_001877 [Acrasis kona]|uniref:Uncharacterized protein n=1 Tax=Acrasis kona TaxID=1008807 RepID=A0AAW2ZB68_9EUKA
MTEQPTQQHSFTEHFNQDDMLRRLMQEDFSSNDFIHDKLKNNSIATKNTDVAFDEDIIKLNHWNRSATE